MVDLSTTYLGLKLRTPIVPSASPLTQEPENVRYLEEAGASAIVFHSVFEEPPKNNGVFVAARPALAHYLDLLAKAKEAVNIPIIASLGAVSSSGWIDYARTIEQAGVDALEINMYQVPSQSEVSGSELENRYIDVVRAVKSAVKIPVAVKLTPFFTSMSNMAKRLDEAGANGLVLFGRFYQPDINIDSLEIQPAVLLSTEQALRLPLTWIGLLYSRIKASLAGTSGVHSSDDVVKLLLAGADVTMTCSSLLRHGIGHLRNLETGLRQWLDKHECESVAAIKGKLSQLRCPDPAAFERAQYLNAVRGIQNIVVTGREAWRILSGE